jgi:hypothetical protein
MPGKPAQKSLSKKKSTPNSEVAAAVGLLEKLMAGSEPITQLDLDTLLASLQGPSATDGLTGEQADERNEAQQIAFEAMEAESEAQARKLAKRALKLDPDCVDALAVMNNDLDARTIRESIAGLRKAVAACERSLGTQSIRENAGH